MDRLEPVKENVQPLREGRKIEILTAALDQDQRDKREATRLQFEKDVQDDSVDSNRLFETYYNYVNWLEQNYPTGRRPRFDEILEQCIDRFHKDSAFCNDDRMLAIFLKYINIVQDPLRLFITFFKAGFGKKLAKFYTEWAYYFEVENNFKRAMKVIDTGIKNEAQPLSELKNYRNGLEVETLRHALSEQQSDGEPGPRKALNCLEAKVKRDGIALAPIERVGDNVAASGPLTRIRPAPVGPENNNGRQKDADEPLEVYLDDNGDDDSNPEETKDLKPRENIKENKIKVDKWVGRKLNDLKQKRQPGEQFEIFVDENQSTQPGVTIEPEKEKIAVALFEDECQLKKYCWYGKKDEIYRDGTEYSFEELRYQRWLEKKTEMPKNGKTIVDENIPPPEVAAVAMENDKIPVAMFEDECQMKKYCWYGKKDEIYRDGTEYSFEELRYQRWLAEQSAIQKISGDQEPQSDQSSVEQSRSYMQSVRELDSRMIGDTQMVRAFFFNGTLMEEAEQTTFHHQKEEEDHQWTRNQSQLDKSMCMMRSIDILSDETCQLDGQAVPVTASIPSVANYNLANCITTTTESCSKLSTILEASREDYSKSSSSSSSSGTNTGIIEDIYKKLHFERQNFNPFDAERYRNVVLAALADPVEFRKGYHKVTGDRLLPDLHLLPCQTVRPSVFILIKGFQLDQIGQCHATPITLRICRRLNDYWEFYIYDDLQRRLVQHSSLGADVELSLMTLDRMVFYHDGYVVQHDLDMRDSVYDIWKHLRQRQESFSPLIIAYVTLELMLIIQKLHHCKIIHSDINPENLVLTRIEQDDLDSLGKRTSFVKLVDFSRAIDMLVLPEDFVFKRDYYQASGYDDVLDQLLMDRKPYWTYEIDWIGFMKCVHQLAFGDSRMKIEQNEDGRWRRIGKEFPELPILDHLFDHLLNLSINQRPVLQPYIDHLVDYLGQSKIDLYDDVELMFFKRTLE